MYNGQPQPPRLHLVSGDAPAMPTPLPLLSPDWQRLLTDLTSFGLMQLRAANGWAELRATGEPWYASGRPPVMRLTGPGVALTALTDRWSSATLERDQDASGLRVLTVRDHRQAQLLSVRLEEPADGRGFHALLVRQWARPAAPAPVPPAGLSVHERAGLRSQGERWPGDTRDGRPSPLPGVAVDPALLLPFLETMVDQACPLRVALANAGLRQRHDDSFHDLRHRHDRLCLTSGTARLTLDIGAIAHARVGPCDGAAAIQLYGDDGHCGLTLALGGVADRHQRGLWHAMLRALAD